MRFFLDTEFIEDGRTIELLSIAVVSEDGAEFYAETELVVPILDGVVTNVPEWVQENVVPHLRGGSFVTPRYGIAEDLSAFVFEHSQQVKPEFWAYYADYDWVAVCQLYGRMIDLPSGWPMYCHDLRQALDERGLQHIKVEPTRLDGAEHDALADARAARRTWYEFVSTFAGTDV